MMRLKPLLLVVFFSVLIYHAADAQEQEATVKVKAKVTLSGTIGKILKAPITIMKTVLKLPITIVQKVVQMLLEVFKQINTAGNSLGAEIVKIIKQVASQIVDVLVSVGVLQGKTTEDVVGGVFGIIQKLITFGVNFEMKISSTIVNTFRGIVGKLDIKEIITKIMNLPIVKNIVQLIKDIKTFIMTNFQTQIDDVKGLIQKEYTQHEDFFKPIFDGISTRILIITNALQALMDGKLTECSGPIDTSKSPSSGLWWQIRVWIYQAKVNIFKVLGLADLADKYEADLDDLKNDGSITSSGMDTTPGMTTMPAGTTTFPPGMSPTPEGMTTPPPEMSTTPEGMTTPPPGMSTTPAGTTTPPPGMSTTPEGMTTPPPGMSTTPGGMTTLPPAMSTMPEGMTTLPPTMTTLAAATTSAPFGSITFSVNGNVTSAGGTTTAPPPTT